MLELYFYQPKATYSFIAVDSLKTVLKKRNNNNFSFSKHDESIKER